MATVIQVFHRDPGTRPCRDPDTHCDPGTPPRCDPGTREDEVVDDRRAVRLVEKLKRQTCVDDAIVIRHQTMR